MKTIKINEIITKEEEYIPETEVEIDNFFEFNEDIFNEINYARESPKEYAEKLEDILNSVKQEKGNTLFMEGALYLYNDLYGSLNESINFLKSQKILPKLIYNLAISDSCEELLYIFVNNPNYKNNNLTYEKRINYYGQPFRELWNN